MGEKVSGSSFLGVPGFFNGKSSKSAWGQTSAQLLDNIILHREFINENGTHYLVNEKWEPLREIKGS